MYNCNILVIDDDNIILELVKVILEEVTSGEVFVFSDSKLALDFVQSDKMDDISLVMCDWLMPDVSGLDILAKLRQSRPNCPFLMVTANATKQLVIDSILLGVNDFVVKPFHTNDLINKVEQLIRNAEGE